MALMLLPSCTQQKPEDMRKYLTHWNGQTLQQLTAQWGKPDNIYPCGNYKTAPDGGKIDCSTRYTFKTPVMVCGGRVSWPQPIYHHPDSTCEKRFCWIDFYIDEKTHEVVSGGLGGMETYKTDCQIIKHYYHRVTGQNKPRNIPADLAN
ncbi:MAG: hypothetical protein U1E36_05915 [Rickettsiales bacterium]